MPVEFKLQFTVGEGRSVSETFGVVQSLRTGPRGRIYVADNLTMTVKVFDSAGRSLLEIGRRGRRFGEFLAISAIHVDEQERLSVLDPILGRMTTFTATGVALTRHRLSRKVFPAERYLFEVSPGRFLALFKHPASEGLFHLFEPRTGASVTSRVDESDYVVLDTAFARLVHDFSPGQIWFTPTRRELLYAPALYNGRIAVFSTQVEIAETAVVQGIAPTGKLYSTFEWTQQERPAKGTFDVSFTSNGKQFLGILSSESRGIFRLADGRIVHWVITRPDGDRTYNVETFSEEGILQSHGPVETQIDGQRKKLPLNLEVLWKDKRDRFYLLEKGEVPLIHVGVLSLHLPSKPQEPEKLEQDSGGGVSNSSSTRPAGAVKPVPAGTGFGPDR